VVDSSLLEAARALPKIELHRHLEGAVRLETLVDIAQQYGIEMPEYDAETLRPFVQMIPGEPRNMQHFLAKFLTLRQFFRSLDIVAEIAREVVIDAALDNIKYMELRFTPPALANLIQVSFDEIVALVCETALQTAAEYDIQIGLIVSMNRHESVEIGEQVLDAALKHRDKGVVALDLAGREPGFSAQPFRNVFRRAKSEGLWVTIHAGEWDGAQSVWDAVGNLYADRVGHGIRALEDLGMVSILAEREITLEVCPSSNVDSGVVENLGVHPLRELDQRGVLTTINTDDPLVSNITLSDEIARVMHHMGFTMEDIKRQTLQAAQSAFLTTSERAALVNRFENWLSAVTLPVSDETS
jgi:adenosine deaminase